MLLISTTVTAPAPGSGRRVGDESPTVDPVLTAPVDPMGRVRPAIGSPNIVLILTDDQRFDTLWAMPTVRARLMKRGVTFANSFVVNSLCCPSRTSLLTGRYSHGTGVYTNSAPYGGFKVFHDGSTLATHLHHAGYTTALVGKYLNEYGGTYIPPGWDHWAAFEMDPPLGNYYYNYQLNIDGAIHSYGAAAGDYSTDVLTQQATQFLQQAHGPFFLYFAPWAPHEPTIPAPQDMNTFSNLRPARPPNFNELSVGDKPKWVQRLKRFGPSSINAIDTARRRQFQALLDVDRSVGRLLDTLKETGQLHNTMVVLASDNGVAFGEHRWTNKQDPYEESIRVPMVIRYDPLTSPPRRAAQLVLNIDLDPTFEALAGLRPSGVDGRSLLPILRGTVRSWRSSFLIEHKSLGGLSPPTFCAVRTKRYLFVHYQTGELELYDLDSDPYELVNRAHDATVASSRRELAARLHDLCNPPPPLMARP